MELVQALENTLDALYNNNTIKALEVLNETLPTMDKCVMRLDLEFVYQQLKQGCSSDEAQPFLLAMLDQLTEETILD